MKMITGFLTPTSGGVRVCGFDVFEKPIEAKRCIGYLPEGAPAYADMTPGGYLRFIGRVHGFRGADLARRVAVSVERAALGAVLDQPIETLSKGYKRRVGIGQALLHDPQVLILDEPTDGLDPNQKHDVRALIREMAPDKTIILSTHILEEVEAVCTRAIIIAQGRIVATGTPAELEARSKYHNAVSIRVSGPAGLAAVQAALSGLGGIDMETSAPGELMVFPRDGKGIAPEIARICREKNLEIEQFVVERGRLDDVFRQITGPKRAEAR